LTQHYLTKSNFKLGSTCLFKLKYSKAKYPSTLEDNEMLKFFAEGGFMVEAIAHAVMKKNPDVKFEETFKAGRYQVRVDAIEGFPDRIVLTEIKARGVEEGSIDQFFQKKKRIVDSKWRPYLEDIAFQVMVVEANFPGVPVIPQLCLVNKNKPSGIEAIYSNIEIVKDGESLDFSAARAIYTGDVDSLRADHFLEFVNVRECVDLLMEKVKQDAELMLQFLDGNSPEIVPALGTKYCKGCEYRGADLVTDGFTECWGITPPRGSHVIDLFRAGNGSGDLKHEMNTRIDNRDLQLADFPDEYLVGMGSYDIPRRHQVECERKGKELVDDGMVAALADMNYPLHFIDFETSRIPVPYLPGMKPYELAAFQFSCHTLQTPDSSELVHREWLNLNDVYPNVEFMRELRDAIGDEGTVLIWSPYELSVLRAIRRQLIERDLLTNDLDAWVSTLIGPTPAAGTKDDVVGARVVDLMKISEKEYCHPLMGGSHSIKKVLPAIWSNSPHLWSDSWFADYYKTGKNGEALDPYKTLSVDQTDFNLGAVDEEEESNNEAVSDGVGAMRAYQDMLYGLHRDDLVIRDRMRDSLLKYCGLDTLAMVIIWKHWKSVSNHQA
jgi:hypothetical protein